MLQTDSNKTLKDFLSLDINEAKLLALLFSCDLIRRVSALMLETAGSSLFLYEFSSEGLPYVFMLTGLFTIFAAVHFIRIKRLPNLAAGITLMGLAAITFLLYLLYVSGYTVFATWGLMIWKSVCVLLSEITFLLIALKFCQYDWRSWRFSAILLTEAIALVTSGLAVTILVYFITPISLVFISSVLLLIAGSMLYSLAQKMDRGKTESATHTVEGIKNSPLQLWLVCAFFLMMALFVMGGYLIEYVFYKGVYAYCGAWLADMTAFFALYHVFVGMLLFITIAAFRQYKWLRGLKFTALTLPFFFFIAAAGCLVSSLWLLTFSRMGKNIFYKMIMTPTAKFFAVPLLPSLGKHLSAVRRIIVEPLSIILAGLLLLWLETNNAVSELTAILFIVALGIMLFAYISYRLYTKVAFNSLNNRYWWGGTLFLEDAALKEAIGKEIMNQDVESTIYYLRAIEVSQGSDIEGTFIYALNHPSARVRLFAISRLEAMRSTLALPILLKMVSSDHSLEVKNRALRSYCVIGGESTFKKVTAYLKVPDLVDGATIGLLKSGTEGTFIGASSINRLLSQGSKKGKIKVASILGSARLSAYCRPLIPLLSDRNIEVRQAAVIAAGKIGSTKLADKMVAALATPELREDASEGILRLGRKALPYLSAALKDEKMSFLEPRLINLIGRIGGNDAATILSEMLNNTSPKNRLQILTLLSSKDYLFRPLNIEIFKTALRLEQERNRWLSVCIKDLAPAKVKPSGEQKEALGILTTALCNEQKQSDEIIRLLKIILESSDDLSAKLGLNTAPKMEKLPSLSFEQRLADIITFAPTNLHEWTEAAALYLVGNSKDLNLEQVLLDAMETKSCLVKETALWALSRTLGSSRIKELAKDYLKDDCKNVAELARFILD